MSMFWKCVGKISLVHNHLHRWKCAQRKRRAREKRRRRGNVSMGIILNSSVCLCIIILINMSQRPKFNNNSFVTATLLLMRHIITCFTLPIPSIYRNILFAHVSFSVLLFAFYGFMSFASPSICFVILKCPSSLCTAVAYHGKSNDTHIE